MNTGDTVKDKFDGMIGTIIDSLDMYHFNHLPQYYWVRWENKKLACISEDKLELHETTV